MSDYRKSKLQEIYMHDIEFKKLVDMLYSAISSHGYLPSELRQAIFLAHYKYEMENPSAMKNRIYASMCEMYTDKDR